MGCEDASGCEMRDRDFRSLDVAVELVADASIERGGVRQSAFGNAAWRLLCREIKRRSRVEENEREQRHYESLEHARLPGYRQTSPLNGDGAHLSTMKVWYHSVE